MSKVDHQNKVLPKLLIAIVKKWLLDKVYNLKLRVRPHLYDNSSLNVFLFYVFGLKSKKLYCISKCTDFRINCVIDIQTS